MGGGSILTGQCMCGAVRLEISEPLAGASACYCKRCQRRTGTSPSISGLTLPGSLTVVEGVEHVRAYRPPDGGWVKSFCANCGGHLFTTHPDDPDSIAVRLGALDQDPGVRVRVHQFVAYAAPWAPVPDDGLPRFPERMPAS
jgi:hypothetical protein